MIYSKFKNKRYGRSETTRRGVSLKNLYSKVTVANEEGKTVRKEEEASEERVFNLFPASE